MRIVALLALLLMFNSGAPKAEPYTIVVGTPPHAPYVIHARVIAQHLPRFLPGNPAMDVKVMPAALGVDALRYVAEMKSKQLLAFIPPNALWETLIGRLPAGVPAIWEFPIIGIVTKPEYVCVANRTLTLDDMRRESLIAGAPLPQMMAAMLPKAYNHVLGTQFRVVTGYGTWANILRSIEQGEVGILCGLDSQYVVTQYPAIGKQPAAERGLRVVMAETLTRDARFPWAIQLADIMPTSARRMISALIDANPGRALHAAPLADVALLRQAFDRMIDDPRYQEELHRLKQEHSPFGSKAAEAHYAALRTMSASVWHEIEVVTRSK